VTIVLALLAVLVPASVTVVGYWIKQQSDRRLNLQHEQDNYRSKIDLALRAIDLFGASSDAPDAASSGKSSAGLLALAHLDLVDLALALLVDLWNPSSSGVSAETAIQVINTALNSKAPDVQLFAAELLVRNANTLDINNSLHWPSSLDNSWIPELPFADKLLIMDALVHTALVNTPNEGAIRTLAVRLNAISSGDPDPRIKGLAGGLIDAILPVVRTLGYLDFIQGGGRKFVTLYEMEEAAAQAMRHPDGFIDRIIENRIQALKQWSQSCPTLSLDLSPGSITTSPSMEAQDVQE
jgi:hypothetical protein